MSFSLKNVAPSMRLIRQLEERIARTLIKDLIHGGWFISVDNGEDQEIVGSQDLEAIIEVMCLTDVDRILVCKSSDNAKMINGWICLVYGNDGYDVVSDYTVNLEPYMKGVHTIEEEFQ